MHPRSPSEAVQRVLDALRSNGIKPKPRGQGWRSLCPAHADHNPSLDIDLGDDGKALIICRAGCSCDSVLAALGLRMRDLFPETGLTPTATPPTKPTKARKGFGTIDAACEAYRSVEGKHGKPLGEWSAAWDYRDADGQVIGRVLRWDLPGDTEKPDKEYRPVFRIDGVWRQSAPAPCPLYALNRLTAERGRLVYVAEGEKCAEKMSELGLLATTCQGGSSAAAKADWSPLAGRKVVILPDMDVPGGKHAAATQELLRTLTPPAEAVVLRLPGLREGTKDNVVEFVERVHGGDLKAAREAIEAATATELATAPRKRATIVELLADPRTLAKPRTIESGWGPFDRVQPFEALEVGTVSVLAAPPGCYKTATMLRLARGFAEQGHCVTWLAGEMQPRTLVRRMVCQAAGIGQAELLKHPVRNDHARRFQGAQERLAALGDLLEFVAAPIGFEELERAADHAQVVFVDYLQLVRHPRPEVRGHERIEEVMAKIAECAQRTEAAFILASAQGRGNGDRRDIQTATRGSSSIEFTVDALYCAEEPGDRESKDGFTVTFDCFKQREGQRLEFEVPIDGRTGLIAEEARP
jgi:hypothetical protein